MEDNFQGFGDSIPLGGNTAVLVVDFINGFTDASHDLGSNLDDEVQETKTLLNKARERNLPIFFTTTVYDHAELEAGHFLKKVPALRSLQRGSELTEVDGRLGFEKKSEFLIEKKYASAFFETPLTSMLTVQNVETLIITGCTTSGCIRASTVDALQHGFKPVVAKECVGDRSHEAHLANLYDMQTKYAEVLPLEKVLQYLDGLPQSKEG